MYEGKLREEVRWSALAVCILSKCTPEQAFEKLCPVGTSGNTVYSPDDSQDMLKMRQSGMRYKDIAQIYNLDKGAVFRRVKRWEEKAVGREGSRR